MAAKVERLALSLSRYDKVTPIRTSISGHSCYDTAAVNNLAFPRLRRLHFIEEVARSGACDGAIRRFLRAKRGRLARLTHVRISRQSDGFGGAVP